MARTKKVERGEFELGEENANPAALSRAKKLAAEAGTIEQKLEALDDESSLASKRLYWIKTQGIPEALRQAGLKKFTGLDGREVAVEDFIGGSLPKEEPARSRAISKLEEYGLGGIIRTIITVDFSREDHDDAVKLYKQLRKNNSYNIEMKNSVHASSYTATLLRRLEDGKPLDASNLNIFIGQTTKFRKSKKGKRK